MTTTRLLSRGARISRWTVGRLLGRGRYGEVYAGVAEGHHVAIKVEAAEAARPRLEHETSVYDATKGMPGQAQCHWFGEQDGIRAMVVDRLGPSVKAVHRAVGNLTEAELRLVASETLERLEDLHGRGWLHCDIKPDNLLLPRGTTALRGRGGGQALVHCVDYGLSLPLHEGRAAEPAARRGTLGAVRYASISNQLLQPLGPRDDLEALCYSLVYLARGRLPWSDITAALRPELGQRGRFALICEAKQREEPHRLCAGLPPAFGEFLRVCRGMAPDERPDYAGLRVLVGAGDSDRWWSSRASG